MTYPTNTSTFPVIFGSGASLTISVDKEDVIGPTRLLHNHKLGGLTDGLKIEGIGMVHWKFITKDSVLTVISSTCYIPKGKVRLISPQ